MAAAVMPSRTCAKMIKKVHACPFSADQVLVSAPPNAFSSIEEVWLDICYLQQFFASNAHEGSYSFKTRRRNMSAET
jgi:hypothetical protein